MPSVRRMAPLLAALAALVALPAGGAGAAAPSPIWATVNVCDTPGAPNTIGIRGAMPGIATKGATMWMRFRVQYRGAKGQWITAAGIGTGFLKIGSASVRSRQSGHSFVIKPPAKGSYLLRGQVTYQWRSRNGSVVRQAARVTESGHRSTAGADPPGYSAAVCRIS